MPDDYAATISTTGTVPVGGSATGVIEKARDVDWFAVQLVAGQTYVVDMAGADGGGGTLGDTRLLGVFDDEGNRVAGKSDGGGKGGDAQLVYTASETGTFYIAGRGGGRYDTGTYTMRVRDRDPDSLAAGATDLGDLGGARLVRKDSVDGGADAADYWRFTLSETQAVTLGLRRQDANADLYLEDADGKVLHSSTNGGTRAEAITATLEAGTYYVRVAAQEAGDNDYWLRARAEDPAPAVQPEQTPVHSPPPAETPAQPEPPSPPAVQQQRTVPASVSEPAGSDLPADTSTAGRVAVGSSATGEIAAEDVVDIWQYHSTDTDWFKVTLEKGKTYRIDVKGLETGDGTLQNPYLTGVYDADGTVLAGSSAYLGGKGDNVEHFLTVAENGTYYLGVGGELSSGSRGLRYDGTYKVSVAEVTDDFAANTNTTGTVTAGSPVAGVIETPDDVDWFKVTLEAGKTYRFDMQAGWRVEAALPGIYDASGDFVSSFKSIYTNPYIYFGNVIGHRDYDIHGYFTPATSGTYYVAAGSDTSNPIVHRQTGSYTLSVEEEVDDFAADKSTTGTVAVGGSANGTIERALDVDWFKVTLKKGVKYQIDLKGRGSGDDRLADPYLLGMHDTEGNLVAGTADNDGGAGLNSRVLFTPAEDGAYYVAAKGAKADHTGAYKVSVTEMNVSEPKGTDFADTKYTQGQVVVGGSVKGRLHADWDIDSFAVSLEKGKTYRFDLKASETGDGTHWDPALFGIYDAGGTYLPGTYNDDADPEFGRNARVFFTAPETAIYYVDAGTESGDEKGTYTLSVIEYPDDYAADTSTTGRVAVYGTATGEITTSHDVDWFEVELQAGKRYQIDVHTLDPRDPSTGIHPLWDPKLYGLYDTDGNLVPGTTNDNAHEPAGDLRWLYHSRVFFTPTEDGTYYVAAGVPNSGQGSANYGAYKVVVTDTSTDDYAATTATAGAVAVGGSTTGRIETPDDRDWFAVTLEAGKTYRFDLTGASNGENLLRDPELYGIHDAEGNLIAGTTDENGGAGNDSRVTFTADASGTYYVAAGADETSPDLNSGYYGWKIRGSEDPNAALRYGRDGPEVVKLHNIGTYELSVEEVM